MLGILRILIIYKKWFDCEISNSIGLITGKGRIEGEYGEYEFQHEVLFTDIFKFKNDGWQYYKSQVTEIKSA